MKKFFYLIIIFLVVGIWLGLNFANNQPFFSDPFADKEVRENASEKVESLTRDAKDAMGRSLDKALGD
ncbi:MAG: hypothetical protein ABFS08_11940 [Pseudomonadota bacterium]